ncbi:MAG: GNAT family N-acetyltransferase [Proteobacteria bacterium]|nr:GNAT family N-acetyltransferase [Pseudomonadota bacterium]
MGRFAIRAATPADVTGIAAAHTLSWRDSYRGILPDTLLDRVDVGQRAATRARILADPMILQLVAYDVTHLEIVGFCDAGESRRRHVVRADAEIYALYFVPRAKRYGLGTEMFAQCRAQLRARGLASLVIWVLENNPHARRFYEALGGRAGPRVPSKVGGFPVVELAYLWD